MAGQLPLIMNRVHAGVGAFLFVLLPAGSRLFGDGFFAWTMYSRSSEYRIDIEVHDASGWRSVAPTGLADHTSAHVGSVLIGAEAFHHGASLVVLQDHLGEFAAFVCTQRSGDKAVVILHQRDDAQSEDVVTRVEAACPPP